MNEKHKWQNDLRAIEQAVRKQKLDTVEKSHINSALAHVIETTRCNQESMGHCGSCGIAFLALILMRWSNSTSQEGIELVRPLCRSLANAKDAQLVSINHLQNTQAGNGLGQKREEDWR